MSRIVNVSTPKDMYESFLDIYPEFRLQCGGYHMFNWSDTLRRIQIGLINIDVKILFSVRKSEEGGTWDQFSALLIPSPEKTPEPDPDKEAEVDIDIDEEDQ